MVEIRFPRLFAAVREPVKNAAPAVRRRVKTDVAAAWHNTRRELLLLSITFLLPTPVDVKTENVSNAS